MKRVMGRRQKPNWRKIVRSADNRCKYAEKDGFDLAASLRRQQPNLQIWGLTASALPQSRDRCLQNGMNLCLFKPVSIQTLTHELSKIETGYSSPCSIRHLKFNVLTENTGGDRALMNEILETFREATLNDIQAAEKAVLQDEPQLFCALFTGCMARRKFWASLRYKTCANLSNPDDLTIFLWQYARDIAEDYCCYAGN